MGYFADGFFTGALASVKETGRKLKNGAKELVEDFISGFNGHGWKLWKRGDSWRLELDELMVRKSFQVFELIINQITAIKGSQAITQGHAKIKDVTIVESADVYKETTVDPNLYYNSRDWRNPYQTANKQEVIATTDTISTIGSVTESQAWVVRKGTKIPAKTVQITVNSTLAKMRYTYSDAAGINRIMEITESGTYNLPESTGKLADNGFFFDTGFNGEIKQTLLPLDTTEEIVQEPCYRIQIDDELNSITEYDLIRCQKGNKFYYVQVGSVFQYYINIPTSEFEANEEGIVLNAPAVGDEIVQFGNASHQEKYTNRHSAIYLHVDEDEPAIDLMTDIYSKDWSVGNILKTRLGGNLPGTDGERGFYCVNGKLLFVDENGDTVSVINPDGSASFARGQISWAKDGNPYFRGYIISGDSNGKRIEINPSSGAINIYDETSKLVNSIEGKSYKNPDDFFQSNVPPLTPNGILISAVQDAPISGFTIEKSFDIFKGGIGLNGVKVEDGEDFKLYFSKTAQFTISNGYKSFNLKIQLVLERLEDGEITVLHADTYTKPLEGLWDLSNNGYSFPNVNGYYIPKLILSFSGAGANSDSRATYYVNVSEAYVRDFKYKSTFFSQGIALGTSPENLAMIYERKESLLGNGIRMDIENELHGLRIAYNGVHVKTGVPINMKHFWTPIMPLLFWFNVNDFMGINIGSSGHPFNSNLKFVVVRNVTGTYHITIPDEIYDLVHSFGDIMFNVIPIGNSTPIQASVEFPSPYTIRVNTFSNSGAINTSFRLYAFGVPSFNYDTTQPFDEI